MLALTTSSKLTVAASLAAAALWVADARVAEAPTHDHDLGALVSDPFTCPICGGSMDDFQALLGLLYELNGRITIEVVGSGALDFLALR